MVAISGLCLDTMRKQLWFKSSNKRLQYECINSIILWHKYSISGNRTDNVCNKCLLSRVIMFTLISVIKTSIIAITECEVLENLAETG